MKEIYIRTCILLVVVCMTALAVFICLNTREEFTPGCSTAVEIDQRGCCPSLLFHDNKLWFSFIRGGKEGPEIAVSCSQDGKEWSSPVSVVKKSSEDLLSPSNPQWLKRSNGSVWLVWSSGRGTSDELLRVISYVDMKKDGTFGDPCIVHSLDGDQYSFSSVTNTPDGGLAVLETYYPPGSAIIGGREVPGKVFSKCVVQAANANLEWNPPIILSQTDFAGCVDIFLDDNGTLWAVYNESDLLEKTYLRASENTTSWSNPFMISAGLTEKFFQRQNQQYVLFFVSNRTSVFMMTSEDGIEWSRPAPVISLDGASGLDVAESGDGTLWIIIDGKEKFCVIKYTDEQYEGDLQVITHFHRKNMIIACLAALIVGIVYFFLRMSKNRNKNTEELS